MLKKCVKGVIAISVVVMLISVVGYYKLLNYMNTPLQIAEGGMDYVLARGGSLSALAHALARHGVLATPRWLILYSKISGAGVTIQAGEYFFPAGITPLTLLEKVERGDVRQYQLTLVEGWTISQAFNALQNQPKLIKRLGNDWREKLKFTLMAGQQDSVALEGLFFPDTYRYSGGVSDEDILIQAYQRLHEVLHEEWQKRDDQLPYNTPYEALIMASLIEKETGHPAEREQIAGVFVRRLKKRMRLQTDPTVIYGLGEAYQGNLRSIHLKDKNNPYNTYRHHGLPPSPIALVGREAIYAALHPAAGDTLYFVAKGDGMHQFSVTLEEHQKAVRKYQITHRRKDYSSAPRSKSTQIN